MRITSWATILLAFAAGVPALLGQQAAQSDRAFERELFRELVETNTSSAFGSTPAAKALAARFRAAGFAESGMIMAGPNPEKQNLVVRLRGDGPAKPILVISHLDVVDAPKEGWDAGLDPFHLTERDGFFYGRGTTDMKNGVAAAAATLIRMKSEKFVPNRDIIMAFTADEEGGNANGIYWLVTNHRDWIDAAYCLNLDTGGGQTEKGVRRRMTVQTSEKSNVSFQIATKNPGGHSSLPGKENAIYQLAKGLVRLSERGLPFRFNETTRTHFERMSAFETGQTAADLKAVSKDPPDLAAAARLANSSEYLNAILRTTCVATQLTGGHAPNALPQTATATVNCRIFPGDTVEFIRASLVEFLADPGISVSARGAARPAPPSPLTPEVMGAVEKVTREMWPGIPVFPVMDPWASDSISLRRAGMPAYGVNGAFGEELSNAHGANERIPVEAYYESVDFLHRLLKTLSAESAPAK
jgi:acetylornithine deacetylase/succinyl-diaminopimelate desuccinylase-like protein